MELEEYISQIKSCPDDRLMDELGICNNFPILLDAGLLTSLKILGQSNKIDLFDTHKQGLEFICEENIFAYFIPNKNSSLIHYGSAEDRQRQKDNYKYIFAIGIDVDIEGGGQDLNRLTDPKTLRLMANTIVTISDLFKDYRICTPMSIGRKYIDDLDAYNRIAYHEPGK